jgi:hypothetical protein
MKLIFLLTILLFAFMGNAQKFYEYQHFQNPCTLMLRSDSVVVRIEQSVKRDLYIESIGKIKRLNDSLYHIIDTAIFSMSIMENDQDEYAQFGISVDSFFRHFNDIKMLSIQYYDVTKAFLHSIKGGFVKYYFDKLKFNNEHNSLFVITNHKNPITSQMVSIKLLIGASIEFSSKYISEFDIIISGKKLKVIGEPAFREIGRSTRW